MGAGSAGEDGGDASHSGGATGGGARRGEAEAADGGGTVQGGRTDGGGGGEQDDAVQGRSGRMATATRMTGVALGGVASEARVGSGGSRAVA